MITGLNATTTNKSKGYRTNMFGYEIDINGMLSEMMPCIHNSDLPQEIKDSWVQFSVEQNISELHEQVYIDTE